MFDTAKHLLKRWLRDTAHYFRTGESTIYGEGGHRVFLHPSGYSRVDSYDLWQSEGAKKALEWASQLHKPQTTSQPTMSTSRDENLNAICDYLKNNPDRLMELLGEIPTPKKMERFLMKELRQEYLKYESKIYRREAMGFGYQWSLYSDDRMKSDHTSKWHWQEVTAILSQELERQYAADCVGLGPSTFIESDNECTYTP